MITTVDTSILLDVFKDHPERYAAAATTLEQARAEGALIASAVVWAELTPHFSDLPALRRAMATVQVSFDAIDRSCAELAGTMWGQYREAGGKRERVLGDFFVGAHALQRGGRLITRDRGFYRHYFRGLVVLS